MQQRGGSLIASTLKPRPVSASSNALSLRVCAQLSIVAAVALLSPALAFLAAIGVEIVIGVLVEAGVPLLPAFASGVIGWLLVRRLRRRRGGATVET